MVISSFFPEILHPTCSLKEKNTAQLQHVQKSSQKSRKIPTHPFKHPTFTKEKHEKTSSPGDSKWPFYPLNLWKGHLSIPKRSQRIGWPRIVPSGKQSTDRVTRVSAGIGLLQSEVLSSLTHFSFTCHQLGKPVERVCRWSARRGNLKTQQGGLPCFPKTCLKTQRKTELVVCTIKNIAKKTQTNINNHLASSVQLDISS